MTYESGQPREEGKAPLNNTRSFPSEGRRVKSATRAPRPYSKKELHWEQLRLLKERNADWSTYLKLGFSFDLSTQSGQVPPSDRELPPVHYLHYYLAIVFLTYLFAACIAVYPFLPDMYISLSCISASVCVLALFRL
jgi:hypothetical protein